MMRRARSKHRTGMRRCWAGCMVLTAGVLSNHLTCSRVVGDPVVDGVGVFLTSATAELLTRVFLPDLDLNGDGSGNGDDDPFEPPIQQ